MSGESIASCIVVKYSNELAYRKSRAIRRRQASGFIQGVGITLTGLARYPAFRRGAGVNRIDDPIEEPVCLQGVEKTGGFRLPFGTGIANKHSGAPLEG